MVRRVWIWFIIALILALPALADQTQLFSKIFLNPYYREGTTAGTQYNYTLSVNPPDGLTHVYSATITFQAYLSPSVNFTLKVNNRSCNTPSYYVSTTYATAGQGVASFDCSNIINKSDNYTLQLTLSKNTGAINGWLDLTYTNKKKSLVALSGTEYQVGDVVKTFLQLSEENIPITNATCNLNIYYPNNTLWQINQSMIYQNGSNGLYFWQGIAPNVTGVYMIDAICQYFFGVQWFFSTDSIIFPIPTTTTGTLIGTGLSLNSYQDATYMTSKATGGKSDNYFDFNTSGTNLTNKSAVLYWMGQSLGTQVPVLSFQVYNWTSATWKLLPNSITLSGTGQSFATGQNDQMQSNNLNISDYINSTNGIVRIRLNSSGIATHEIYHNWLSIMVLNPSNQFLDNVRGGGEIHISNLGATQTGLIQSILDYLTNTIYPYLTQIWNKLLGIETQLNTTINITNQSLVLDTEINQTTHGINTKLDDINQSMMQGFAEKDAHIQSAYDNLTEQINNFSQNTTNNFNYTWSLIQSLNSSQSNAEILSYLANLTLAINDTQTQLTAVNQSVIDNMNSINQSLSSQINISTNTTQTLITALNSSNQARFDQLESYLQNLSIQISNNQNITQSNITQLQNLMLSVNMSLTTDINNLNTSLYNVRTDLLTQINQSYQYMIAMNQSINNNLILINTSLSSAIQTFRNEVQANFSNIFSTLTQLSTDLNGTKTDLQSGISNLSQQLTATNASIQAQLIALNISVQQGFAEKDAHIQSAYDNLTSQISNLSFTWNGNFTQVLDKLDNLSIQIDNNQNITQSNISYINNYLDNLNTSIDQGFSDLNSTITNKTIWLNATLTEMKSEISNTENMTIIINQSVAFIIQYLNITAENLSLSVTAPSTCLVDTNWVAKAQVKDRFGVTLSYLDGVQCNMTTDLWGVSNMSYSFIDAKFKYIHTCDPTNTTFNWSVNCLRS